MMENKGIKKFILLGIFYICYTAYMVWRIGFTIPFGYGAAAIIFGLLLLIAEAVGYLESIIFYMTVYDTTTPSTPKVRAAKYPEVDVFVTAYNEPLELLFKTVVGCRNMDYPDKNKNVHIHICDDGHREEIREMCREMEIGYITRDNNLHAKAGNLNNALRETSAPLVVTFDADMIPAHDFLMKTIPFFMQGNKVGFVQVPQNFYNSDSFQYNLFSEKKVPNEQQLFARLIQAGKMKFNAVIYAGSNTVISRQALDEIGGFVVGTITEDFATGMLIEAQGYEGVYLNEVHASGLAPENLEDLYNQRIRWGRGVIQTFKAHNPFKMKGINLKQKLMYFSALSYWYFGLWRFIFFLSPILFSVFGLVVLKTTFVPLLCIWLPMFLLSEITFRVFSNNFRTTTWSHIYDTVMFPQITLGVIMETLGLKMTRFKVTPKENVVRETFQTKYRLVWLQLILLLLSIAGLVKIVISVFSGLPLQIFAINLFWLVYNIFLLSTAVFFASERPKFRRYERLPIEAKAVVSNDRNALRCKTFDISENGVSVIADTPVVTGKETIWKIKIERSRYTCDFSARLVYSAPASGGTYKLAFKIENIDRANFCQLILIIYDRTTSLVYDITGNNYLKFLLDNVVSRCKPFKETKRKIPRFIIDKSYGVKTPSGEASLLLRDISQTHCSVKSQTPYDSFELRFGPGGGYILKCALDLKLSNRAGEGSAVYKILNRQDDMTEDFFNTLERAGNLAPAILSTVT